MTTAPHVVACRGISRRYREGDHFVSALARVDLEIERGEFVALWGPSGSGKTTLLNIVGLIDRPDEGRVILADTDTAGLDDHARANLRNRFIGFVFQHFDLIPVLSVSSNVALPLEIRGERAGPALARANTMLAKLGIAEFGARQPDQLSGGQKQRVGIARALVGSPELVIADEPTANLDGETARDVVRLMQGLNRDSGVTFLFATHDPRLIEFAQRRIRIADGRIVEDVRI